VQAHPHLFAADGSLESDWPHPLDVLDDMPPDTIQTEITDGKIPPERRLTVTRTASIQLDGGSLWTLAAGDVVDANDPIVRQARRTNRGLFKKG
jgi:hypothetical protein